MRCLVLDGNSIINRAFYGIKVLTTRDGRFTNAIYGFMNILLGLLHDYSPDEVAIAFDLKAPTFRHKMYSEYKAGRHAMPDELAQQLPVLKDLLTKLGFCVLSAEGWEADDILGTISAACSARGDECFLATGDRDSLQLVNSCVTVLLAATKGGRSETRVMDPAAIRETYGLDDPAQLIQVKGLMGDTSDHIPGVAGIGEKTALGLISRFGTLEGVYENIQDPFIKPAARAKLLAGRESAEMSRILGTIRTDAPVPTQPGSFVRTEGDPTAAAQLLTELEMFSILQKLDLHPGAGPKAESALLQKQPLPLPETLGGVWLVAPQASTKDDLAWYGIFQNEVYALPPQDLLGLLGNPDVQIKAFDCRLLYRLALQAGVDCKALVADAKLAAYLLDPLAGNYEVASLAASYGVTPAFACEAYPDAGVLQGLFDTLDHKIQEEGMAHLLNEIEFPLARVLAEMTHVGMAVDAEGIRRFGEELKQGIQALLQQIYEQVGYEFNVNSPKQLGEALFVKMGLPTRKKTKSGFSTDAQTLESLRPYTPVIDQILQYRSYQKLYSTYCEGLLKALGPDGRLHSTFNQTEARTGRLSSSEPNLQNIPIRTELGSRMRAFFTATPGHVLLDADYSQIELRLLAHISQDAGMQQAFLSGEDIHRSTAAKVYDIPAEEVTPLQRASAKAVSFGIVYGISGFSLAKDLGITNREAEAFIQNYLSRFEGVRRYRETVVADAYENGYVSTLFGRRRPLPELSAGNFNVRMGGERMALNTPIQGTAADIIKLAMVRVSARLKAEGLTARLILQVHDELIVEAPLAEAERAAQILGEEMRGVVQYSVPLTADVHSGSNWLEAHS